MRFVWPKGGGNLKIAFWSNVHGQAAVTSNMLALAIHLSMRSSKKSILLKSHFQGNIMEEPLIGTITNTVKEYFEEVGIDALIRNTKTDQLCHDVIKNCSVSLMRKKLDLIPGTTKVNEELYNQDMIGNIKELLEELETYYDLIWMDIEQGNSLLSQTMLELSDIIIVNLSPNHHVIQDYISNYKLPPKKIIHLFGMYDKDSFCSLKNIARRYDRFKRSNLCCIPYNVEYRDAWSNESIISFFYKNEHSQKGDSNFYFMKEIENSNHLILKMLHTEMGDGL